MMMKNIFFYFLLFLFSGLPVSWAFTLNNTVGASFPSNDVDVNVASHTCNNIGISNQALLDMVEEAVDEYWNKVPTSRLRLRKGSLVSVGAAFNTEPGCSSNSGSCTPNPNLIVASGILISCNIDTGSPANFGSGVIAVTIPNNISGKNINGSLVLLNDKVGNAFQDKSHAEQVAIIAHEIGHGIGLGHSPVDDSLMFFSTIPNRLSLGWDDIDGISYLYPTGQPFTGCGSISVAGDEGSSGPFILTFALGVFLILGLSILRKKLKA